MEIRKDVLYPRMVHPPGFSEPLDMAPLIAPLTQRVGEMRAAGLQIPMSWAHQTSAVPMTLAELEKQRGDEARNTFGWVEGAEVDDAGVLYNRLEVPDEKDRQQLSKTRYVSPHIKWDWRDGTGRVWPGPSILHLAATSKPVQHHQQAFKLSADEAGLTRELFLSLDDYSLHLGDTVAEETDKKPPKAEDAVPEEKPPEEEPTEPDPEAADNAKIKEILPVLARNGIVLPANTNRENFFDRVHTAVLTMEHHTGTGDQTPENTAVNTPKEVPAPMNPIGLSMDQVQTIERAKRAEANALNRERRVLGERIEAVFRSGRCDVPSRDKMLATLKDVKLGFDDSGELSPNDVLTRLSVYESLPRGAVWPPALRLSHEAEPRVVPDPEQDTSGTVIDEAVNKMTGGLWDSYKAKQVKQAAK